MADKPKSPADAFLDKRAPNLTPEQRQAWMYAFAPQSVPTQTIDVPTVNVSKRGVEFSAPPAPPPLTPAQRAIVQANGGSHASGTSAPRSLFDMKFSPTGEGPSEAYDASLHGDIFGNGSGEAPSSGWGSGEGFGGPAVAPTRGASSGPTPAERAAASRQPKGGNWDEARAYQASVEAQKRADNLAGATFATGPRSAPGATGGVTAPVMLSPGGMQLTGRTRQIQEGLELGPEVTGAAVDAENAQRAAAQARLDADRRAAEGELDALHRHEFVQQAHETELRERADRQRAQLDTSLARLDDMTSAVAADRIDPEQWWSSRSTAQKFAVGMGLMLGGVAQGLRGGPNVGLEMMNGAIAQNIDAQKSNARLRREKLEDQRGLLGQLARTFGDERVAEEAAWVMYLERAKTQLAAAAADAKSDYAKARYADSIAQISGQGADRLLKFKQLSSDRIMRQEHESYMPPTYAGGGGKAAKPDEFFVPTGPNGEGFQARTEKEAQAARGLAYAKQNIGPMLDELKRLRAESNAAERGANRTGVYESERMARIKSLQAQVALGLRELQATSPGAMDKGMQELAGQVQGNWESVQGHPEAAADAFMSNINRQLDAYGAGQGALNQRQGITVGPSGYRAQAVGQPSFRSPPADLPSSFRKVE